MSDIDSDNMPAARTPTKNELAECGFDELQGLNEKQLKFVTNYLQCGNPKKAALDAGYSEVSVSSQVSYLLRHPKIKAFLDKSSKELLYYMGYPRISRMALIIESATRAMKWDASTGQYVEDHRARLDARKFLCQMAGDMETVDIDTTNIIGIEFANSKTGEGFIRAAVKSGKIPPKPGNE